MLHTSYVQTWTVLFCNGFAGGRSALVTSSVGLMGGLSWWFGHSCGCWCAPRPVHCQRSSVCKFVKHGFSGGALCWQTHASLFLQLHGCPGADGPTPSTSIVSSAAGRGSHGVRLTFSLQLVCVQLDFSRFLYSILSPKMTISHIFPCVSGLTWSLRSMSVVLACVVPQEHKLFGCLHHSWHQNASVTRKYCSCCQQMSSFRHAGVQA